MNNIKNDNDNYSTEYSSDLDYVTEEYYVEIVTPTICLSFTDVGSPNGGFKLSNSLNQFDINTSLKYLRSDPVSSYLENVNNILKGYLTNVARSEFGLSLSDPLGNFKLDPNASYLENVNNIAKGYLSDTATSGLGLSLSDVSYSIDGIRGLDEIDINTPLGSIKIDPNVSSLENLNNIAKGYLSDVTTSVLSRSSPDVSYSIGGVELNAGLDGVNINTLLGNIKIDPTASCLENVNNIAKGYLTAAATSALGLSSSDVRSYSIGGVAINAGLDEVGINTSLGNIKIDPKASCLENVNNIAKGYLTDAATSALGLSSPDVSYSIGRVGLNAGLDEVGINTSLGNIKIDPKALCTENLTNAVTGLLNDSVNQEIDQFCSDFNDTARLQTDSSAYSDGTTAILAGQINAGATIGRDGLKANAQADGSLAKHKLGDADISIGQGQAYATASIGADGVKVVAGGEINALTVDHDKIQAKIGLSVKTGVEVSTTNFKGTVVGVGLNIGTDGVGISIPFGSINLKR
ncbi:unnamed protein product [Rotaria sp. Silwood1]|nr:unnamed protein product [Rotaria sp. Silwood1]CAF4802055.1 unnamed protein product [Rotaria sp. Silwood1]